MSKKLKKKLLRIVSAAALMLVIRLLPELHPLQGLLYLIPYLLIGWDILLKAVKNIGHGQIFDENFLMALATVGAIALSDYAEACFVMLFYQIGEWFQSLAVGKSRNSISALLDLMPDTCRVLREEGTVVLDPMEVEVGERFEVLPGERFPLDGVVEEGSSEVNLSPLTGESIPVTVSPGAEVYSGCVNLSGRLLVRSTKYADESTASRIAELVEGCMEKKAQTQDFISKFARFYTPAVVFSALALLVIGSLFLPGGFSLWLHRALIFLVVSCPCALVVSIPLSFYGGIGGASRSGALIKGAQDLDLLSRASIAVFDKTGTLTKGNFTLSELHPCAVSEQKLLESAVLCEYYSEHPIARSLKEAWLNLYGEIDLSGLADAAEHAGQGVTVKKDGKLLAAGSLKLMHELGISVPDQPDTPGSLVFVAEEGIYLGYLTVADEIKADTAEGLRALRELGIRKTVMLTGDAEQQAALYARALSVDEHHAGLLPEDKLAVMERLKEEGTAFFAGDGINDAPVLAAADVGFAMGALGSDAAIEAADIVLMNDSLVQLASTVRIAKRTMRIVYENIVFCLAVKLAILVLSAFGIAGMGLAVFGDVGVAFICILNALRALKKE